MGDLLADAGIAVVLLTGSLKAAGRKAANEAVATGQAQVVVGTHALLQESVSYARLDLVVIDECHRGSAREDSAWREILDYFEPAIQLGLTATPKETRDVSTLTYFRDPVYTYSLKQGIDDGSIHPDFVTEIPMRRMARPAEIARSIAYLASDDASYVTGETLVVDWGLAKPLGKRDAGQQADQFFACICGGKQGRDLLHDILSISKSSGQGDRAGNGLKILIADFQGQGAASYFFRSKGAADLLCLLIKDNQHSFLIPDVLCQGGLSAYGFSFLPGLHRAVVDPPDDVIEKIA